MTTEQMILDKYGPLLTLSNLAELLNRSPQGLRVSLATERTETRKLLHPAKIKIGRRTYFRTCDIAKVIDSSAQI